MWHKEIWHNGLNKYQVVRGRSSEEVERRARATLNRWEEQWRKLSQASLAEVKTNEARELISQVENFLTNGINSRKISWDALFEQDIFQEQPKEPAYKSLPSPPNEILFKPRFSFWHPITDRIFKENREKRELEAKERYRLAYSQWKKQSEEIKLENEKLSQEHDKELEFYEFDKNNLLEKKSKYLNGDSSMLIEFCEMVLSQGIELNFLRKEFRLDYQIQNKLLVVELELPTFESFPKTKEFKYSKTTDSIKEVFLPETKATSLYDGFIYQYLLLSLYLLFDADSINALETININGWVDSVDKATGNPIRACIASIQATRDEIFSINFENIDPKACFKSLKGVGSSKLYSLTPVPPLITLNRNDRRFVQSYDVAETLSDSINLAAMEWQDFEHLIREIFEKEFLTSGGEVKVTQASRDGGVDAIAFDPDPIRGGKIVIQAKRYTNTVGVSAVRDLYGTVLNEGATKGILVTTADYGPDAFEFSKGKPLTLLSGGNLLHLLEKHGHRAHINLKDAKKINAEREKYLKRQKI